MRETLANRAAGITGGFAEKAAALPVSTGRRITVPDDSAKFDMQNFEYENVLIQLNRPTDAKLKRRVIPGSASFATRSINREKPVMSGRPAQHLKRSSDFESVDNLPQLIEA